MLSKTGVPEKMNNPLCYEPHPLCIAVCKELQAYLENRADWREEIDRGKMFGVLIVGKTIVEDTEQKNTQIGYLAAYSGQIGGRSDWEDFVPAVFDYLQPDGYFKTHEAEITRINQSIKQLEDDERMKGAKKLIASLTEERKKTIAAYQVKIKEAKAKRDERRQEALQDPEHKALTPEEEQAMTKESQFMKAELRRLKKSLAEKTTLETEYADYQDNLQRLKQLRKTLSDALQQWLFSQFRMLNYQGESKDLLEIFRDAAFQDTVHPNTAHPNTTFQDAAHPNTAFLDASQTSIISKRTSFKMVPPAGSGECCEPKLLQYAYQHGYKPLQMAMFWWGESPKEEIRHHLQFYPACNGKCKPILHWMLPDEVFATPTATASQEKGISIGKNISTSSQNGTLYNKGSLYNKVEILFEDQELAVIYKPEGLLSVPGKDSSQPSLYALMRKKYPSATGPLIVHRLDMATSGLMIIAKTEFAYHRLQKEFLGHRVQKKYIAIIGCKDKEACDSLIASVKAKRENKATLSLPLMPDYLDRPRQIVHHEQGKEAVTEYEIVERIDDTHLRLALYPKTGRTHQLRVHCAHQEGLNAPILGDPLYGNEKSSRLHLHAEEITFEHPLTGKKMTIKRKADF